MTRKRGLLLAGIAALGIVSGAGAADAKMTHKWDEDHYAQGKFRVKKSEYPPQKQMNESAQAPDSDMAGHHVKIDHKGRLYKKPLPREDMAPKN